MCAGEHACRSSTSHKALETEPPFCRRRSSVVEADGVLLKGGAFLCGKGCNDFVCKVEDSRAGSKMFSSGWNGFEGKNF